MQNFLKEYESILSMALQSGIKKTPILPNDSISEKTLKQFVSACNRGYEKAQTRIIEFLIEMNKDKSILKNEKIFRELALRRIIDAIAFTALKTESHVARRFVLHDRITDLDLEAILKAKISADKMNRESRLTFSLLADLSTFIHVGDILRIDFRKSPAEVSIIELKTGKVNSLLLSQIENYQPTKKSLELLDKDPLIDKKYVPQAKRMLRQRIRIKQVQNFIKKGEGIDLSTGRKLKFFQDKVLTDTYEETLNKICSNAKQYGCSAASIQHCIHLGAGYSDNINKAEEEAKKAACYAAFKVIENPQNGLNKIRQELLSLLSEGELLLGFNMLISNLYGQSDHPFLIWSIDKEHILSLIEKKLCIYSIFDLPSFICLGRTLGLKIGLCSKKETAKITKEIGSRYLLLWGNRGLQVVSSKGKILIGKGLLSHLINTLKTPIQFIQSYR